MWLLERIAALDGLNELVLTTIGSQLDRYATDLIDAGVKRINVSLDTLKPDRFKAITRIGDLERCYAASMPHGRQGSSAPSSIP